MQTRSESERIVAEHGFDAFDDNVCLLDRDNRIVYCNAAWDRFALANDGELATSKHVNGVNVLSVCTDQLRGFYRQMLNRCRSTGLPVSHGYTCSSSIYNRATRMTLRPHATFISMQHTMLAETKHTDVPHSFDDRYVRSGVVKMCANCRRTYNHSDSTWEWIPQLLVAMPNNASHGLCEPCTVFYFGPNDSLRTS
jgi:hypothetical protein